MLIITIGEMLWMPMAMGWVAHRSERGNRSMHMSYRTMTYAVAAIVAPTLGGQIYQVDQNLVWYLSIGVGLIVLAGFYSLDRLLAREVGAGPQILNRAMQQAGHEQDRAAVRTIPGTTSQIPNQCKIPNPNDQDHESAKLG